MSKRKATDAEIIEWALNNPAKGYDVAGSDRIKNHFVCGTNRALRLAREARDISSCARKDVPDPGDATEAEHTPSSPHRSVSRSLNDDGTGQVVTRAEDIRTVEDALEYAEVDTSVWGVKRSIINKWDMGYKDDAGQARTKGMWQVKVWLQRKEALELGLERIIASMPDYDRPRYELKDTTPSGSRLLEVAIYDQHFSMLAWAAETGENYDLNIARLVWNDAVHQIVQRNQGLDIGQILMPIGNDFVHINDPTGQTPRSGNRLDVDSRLAKIIEQCELALVDATEALKGIAPVKLVWIPGNHDPQTSYYLLRMLNSHYRNDDRVEVDTSPKPRKYMAYGVNLIGWLHGCDIAKTKRKQLPHMMADEAADLWAPGQYREIHHGHQHKKGEMSFASASQYGSVVVRSIPSLAATDYWHFKKGYVGNSKTAQYFLYDRDYGLEGVHDVHVDIEHYRDGEEP